MFSCLPACYSDSFIMIGCVFGFPLLQFQLVLLHALFLLVQCCLLVRFVHSNLHSYFNLHLHNTLLPDNNWYVITILTFSNFRVVSLLSAAILFTNLTTKLLTDISLNFLLLMDSIYFKSITICTTCLINVTLK